MCDSSSAVSNQQYALFAGHCVENNLEHGEVRKVTIVDFCSDGSPCVKVSSLYVDSPVPVPDSAQESSLLDQVRKLSIEFLCSAIIVTIIVGYGIMDQSLII
ncbi:hypothetical protein EON65_49195 [archaeon]|nr:MAG: hypothetical protein EON65_49195 [archaeon]